MTKHHSSNITPRPNFPEPAGAPLKLAVFISGRGSNLEAIVQAIAEKRLQAVVSVVISDNAGAKGLELAAAHGILTKVIERRPREKSSAQFNSELHEAIKTLDIDLVVLAGFMRLLTSEFLSHFPDRVINIHPSLLPAFPGVNVQAQALYAGVKFAGCTVHFVVEAVDAGPIIAQAVVPVMDDDSVESLSARILEQEHRLLPSVLEAFSRNEIKIVERDNNSRVVLTSQPIWKV